MFRVICLVIGYFLGCIQTAYFVGSIQQGGPEQKGKRKLRHHKYGSWVLGLKKRTYNIFLRCV